MFRFFRKKPEDPPAPVATVIPAEATGDQRFAAALYPLLLAEPGNAIFSPYSIAAALTIVQAGASGPAREEIEAALGQPGAGDRLIEGSGELARELAARSEPTPFEKHMVEGNAPADAFGCLSWANAIWHQTGYPIRAEFVDALENTLGAELRDADFTGDLELARQKVNAWAAEATRDKIREILSAALRSSWAGWSTLGNWRWSLNHFTSHKPS
jgi:serpin B